MRTSGLSGAAVSAYDDGCSTCGGSAPQAASRQDKSSPNGVPNRKWLDGMDALRRDWHSKSGLRKTTETMRPVDAACRSDIRLSYQRQVAQARSRAEEAHDHSSLAIRVQCPTNLAVGKDRNDVEENSAARMARQNHRRCRGRACRGSDSFWRARGWGRGRDLRDTRANGRPGTDIANLYLCGSNSSCHRNSGRSCTERRCSGHGLSMLTIARAQTSEHSRAMNLRLDLSGEYPGQSDPLTTINQHKHRSIPKLS